MPDVAIAIGEKWPAVDLLRFARENEGQRAGPELRPVPTQMRPRVLGAALVLPRESERPPRPTHDCSSGRDAASED